MPTPQSLLVCWDFNGVLDTYGQEVEQVLQAIQDRGGQSIVVTSAPAQPVRDYLNQRQLLPYFNHVYGMDKHHGLVVRHKVAAISGHLHDNGPFAFCLVVGDSLSDIADGQEAGAHTCLFDPHHSFDSPSPQPDYIIHKLIEVLDLLPIAFYGNDAE